MQPLPSLRENSAVLPSNQKNKKAGGKKKKKRKRKRMKLFRCLSPSISLQNLRYTFNLSTIASSSSSSSAAETLASDSLYNRIRDPANRDISVVPILEKWIEEGKSAEKYNLKGIVKQLKRLNRHGQALEVSMWMSDQGSFPLSIGDLAERLNLIYKVRGLEQAENYFKNIPKQNKARQTYGALLNCYAEEKSVEKAASLFEKMKKLKLLTSFSYNVLMGLYSRIGQLEKMENVFQEMKENSISPDTFTDHILLDAYATALNIDKMEEVLKKIEQLNTVDFHRCANAVRAYVKVGLKDKALEKLKMAEKLVPQKTSRSAWGFLLTLYADIGNKDEMYRIWKANKSLFEKTSNSIYMCMISGLLKFDDIDGAEAFFDEWKSQFTEYDIRIPKILINYYCEKGLLSKAEPLVYEAVESGDMLSSNTWANLAEAYFKANEIPKAVEMMKRVEAEKTWWKPSHEFVNASLEYFEEQEDMEAAENFLRLVKQLYPLTREIYHHLIKIYLIADKPVLRVLDRMKADGFDVDEETRKILEENYEN